MQINEEKITEQEAFIKQRQEKIDMLMKYQDDMERDIAYKGAALVEKERELQLAQVQSKKDKERIDELRYKLR